MSVTLTTENVLNELRKTEARAAEAFAAAEKLKADMQAEGANPLDPDNFARLDDAYKAYDALKSEIENDLKPQIARLQEIDGMSAPTRNSLPFNGAASPGRAQRGPTSVGERFSTNDLYRQALANGHMSTDDGFFSAMHAGLARPVEVLGRDELKAAIRRGMGGFMATTVTGSGSNSAGEFVVPDMQSGVIGLGREIPTLASVVTVGTTDSDTVEYVQQVAGTDAAAPTAETSAAPESAYSWATKTVGVEEITHFVPVTRRALADAGQVATIIDGELLDGVTIKRDSQMASGSGMSPQLKGIYNTSGIGNKDQGSDSPLDAIHKAMTTVRVAYPAITPDYIGINPVDAESLRLAKDANGNYLFGNLNSADAVTPWGLPLLTSSIFTAGKPLVGAFRRGATLWIREGLTVNTGLNGDDFKYRRVSMLATQRVAFAVVRPGAFCTVTLA